TPNFIAGFRETTGYPGPLYSDAGLGSYKAAGLKRGVLRTLNPMALAYGARTMAHGHFQGRTQGDPFQQGGVLVILPRGRIVFGHGSRWAGDTAPAGEVVAALEEATGRKAS